MKTWLIAFENKFLSSDRDGIERGISSNSFYPPGSIAKRWANLCRFFNCLSSMKNAFAKKTGRRWEEEKLIKTTKHYKFYLCSTLAQFVRFKCLGAFELLWNFLCVGVIMQTIRFVAIYSSSFMTRGTFLIIFLLIALKI